MALNRKNDGGESSGTSSKAKQYILAGLAVALIAFAIYQFASFGGSSSSPRSTSVQVQGPGEMQPGIGRQKPKASKKKNKTVKLAPVQLLEITPAVQKQLAAAQEYRARYDQTVKGGNWSALANWAYGHGLYVEAFHCAAMAEQPPLLLPKLHNTRFLMVDPETKQWAMMSQKAFEKALPVKRSFSALGYQAVVDELSQMEASSSISNQTQLAHLLVMADCSRGRELFQDSIKEKGFYQILIREMTRTYLDGVAPEQVWQASWLNSKPMNLWLIEEMIKLDPSIFTPVEKKGKKDKKGRKGRKNSPPEFGPPPGMPGMPGMDPMMGPNKTLKPLPGLAHRLLLLQILVRRGGVVSADLIGELFEVDEENTLFTGVCQGQVDPRLLTRFTEIYAEPMVRPIARGFETFDGDQQQWQGIANVLARMNNDRMASLVFATGQKRILSTDVVFSLAACGSSYSLDHLVKFVQASKVQDVNVQALFATWTCLTMGEQTSFWGLVSQFLPGDSTARKTGKSNRPFDAEMMGMPEGMPGGMPPGQFPGMGPEGMPPMPAFAGSNRDKKSGRRDKGGQKTHGWPLERRFASSVDAVSAQAFLRSLGQLEASGSIGASNEEKGRNGLPPFGPGMYGPGMRGQASARPIGDEGKVRVKRSAVQCLVALDDGRLADYFQGMINDAQVGDYARLGLCVLNDRDSCSALLTHFWKHPLELNVVTNKAKSSRKKSEELGVTATAGHIGVPLDSMGLPRCGVSAREALIYFDYQKAGEAFLSALGTFITQKNSYDHPAQVAEAACILIEALGRWNPPNTAATLADLIESTSDFGLRGDMRQRGGAKQQNLLATNVRMKALAVLGEIGDEESMNVILRIARYSRPDELLGLAAKVALAKRGIDGAADIFLDMLDPTKQKSTNSRHRRGKNAESQLAEIDSSLHDVRDIAFLGVSRVRLNDRQVGRVLELVTTLGGQKTRRGADDFQERLVLSLLEAGQADVLGQLAQMVGAIPEGTDRRNSLRDDPYYWNRVSGEDQDALFLAMIQALEKQTKYDSEDAVAIFISAILRREEAVLIPDFDMLEGWDPAKCVVEFEAQGRSRSRGPGGFGGMMPPEFSQQLSPRSSKSSRRKGRRDGDGFQVDIKFPEVSGGKKWMPHQASIRGLKLIGHLKNAENYLKKLQAMEYFRYFADLILWENGFEQGGEEFVRNLAARNIPKNEMYLQCLAIDQLRQSDNLDLTVLLADVLAKSSNPLTASIVGDGAMYVAIEAWREQMMGERYQLSDTQQVASIVEAWKSVVDGKKFDWALANRLVVALAPLQAEEGVIKWLNDIVRTQCSRSEPVAESAVGSAVEMLRTLNPGGNAALLDFYTTVLEQTYDPEKVKEAMEKAKSQRESAMAMNFGGDFDMSPLNKKKRSSRSRSRNRRRSRSKPVSAYQAIGPQIVQAIGGMTIPEAQRALLKLAKSREDLLAVIAMHVYVKDVKQGRSLFKQLFDESGRNSDFSDQAKQALNFLMFNPDLDNVELLVRAIIKADSSVGSDGLDKLITLYKENQLPSEFDVNRALAQMVMGLTSQLRSNQSAKSLLEKVIEFAEPLQDPDINKLIERAQKTMEMASKRGKTRRRKKY